MSVSNANRIARLDTDEDLGKVAIVTDSVAQVPKSIADELEISIVPSLIIINGKEYRDGIDIDPHALYVRMRREPFVVQTTAPPVGQFYETFVDRIQTGADAVFYIGLTSQLSATYSSAEAAAFMVKQEFPECVIELYDSRIATIAQGFIAIEAAKMAVKGASLKSIVKRAHDVRSRVGFVASLATLEYLMRGGRIGRVAYMMGSLIKAMPIVTIDENGWVAPTARVRGEQKINHKMVDYVVEKVKGYRKLQVAIMHADAIERARQLEVIVRERLTPDEFYLTDFTPVMGVHAGPGVVGVAYYYE